MSTHGGTSTSAPPATTVTGPDAIGAPAVVGTGLHYARNDHHHGLPALDYNAMQYNDLLGWSQDPSTYDTQLIMPAAATIFLARIPLPAAVTVTNVLAYLSALGGTLTHSFLALFKSNGTIVGQSADQSTPWEAGGTLGLYTLPLAGGPFVVSPLATNDFVWAAIYVGTAVTLPTFETGVAAPTVLLNAGCTAARSRDGQIAQANTATLASIVPANILTTSGYNPWLGIS